LKARTKPLRVLIADDHPPTRDDVCRALGDNENFDICAVVADAVQAVQAAVLEQPDICLLDIRMPGSGVAAAWEIAARLPHVKIVCSRFLMMTPTFSPHYGLGRTGTC
jgi:DNA-binding NarL/FixJ family response regulator